MLSVATSVPPFSAGDLRSIFYYWRSVLIESTRKQAFLGLGFSCFAFFDIFAFRNPPPERVCAVVFLRAFILFASFLSDSAPFRRAQTGFAGRTCIGRACTGWLYRVDFTGSACAGSACAGSACVGSTLPSWLYRVGFTGLTLPDRLCRVGLRRPSDSHKGSRCPFSWIFARGIPYCKTY